MIEFFKFLQLIRKTYNKDKKKSLSISIVAIFISSVLCIVADMNLPDKKWSNFVKIIPVLLLTLSLFFTSYSLLNKKQDEEKRAKLDFYQRVNISIFIITILIMFHLLFLSTTSAIYSLITSIILCLIMWTFVFIRPFKHELDKAISELESNE